MSSARIMMPSYLLKFQGISSFSQISLLISLTDSHHCGYFQTSSVIFCDVSLDSGALAFSDNFDDITVIGKTKIIVNFLFHWVNDVMSLISHYVC